LAVAIPFYHGVYVVDICAWDLELIDALHWLLALKDDAGFVGMEESVASPPKMISMLVILVPGYVL
jgi:hypothetical protein